MDRSEDTPRAPASLRAVGTELGDGPVIVSRGCFAPRDVTEAVGEGMEADDCGRRRSARDEANGPAT